jgi:hypothetical protein
MPLHHDSQEQTLFTKLALVVSVPVCGFFAVFTGDLRLLLLPPMVILAAYWFAGRRSYVEFGWAEMWVPYGRHALCLPYEDIARVQEVGETFVEIEWEQPGVPRWLRRGSPVSLWPEDRAAFLAVLRERIATAESGHDALYTRPVGGSPAQSVEH